MPLVNTIVSDLTKQFLKANSCNNAVVALSTFRQPWCPEQLLYTGLAAATTLVQEHGKRV
jgi:hypothetical protein